MKSQITKNFTILFLSLIVLTVNAQESVLSSGGNISGIGGSISYAIGQIIYTSNVGSNGSVSQGVQQAYEISVVTGIEDSKGVSLDISIYPNPTIDYLKLSIDTSTWFNIQSISYQLYDMNNKLMEEKEFNGKITIISMVNFAPATYYLSVINNNKVVKIFKVIKN